MVRHLHVIGIGSGNPDHLTREAIHALNQVDVFLVADKGAAKRDLVGLRLEICRRFISDHPYRFIEVPDPRRGPDAERDSTAYRTGVLDWHAARVERYAEVLRNQVGADEVVGLLVWGDPAVYDSTLRIVEGLRSRRLVEDTKMIFDYSVVPGISSVSVLAARHRIVLNRIGTSIHITTGRRLVEGYDPALGDVVVMLDGDLACSALVERHPDLMIFWGANLGLPEEALVSGRLVDVLDEIRQVRSAVRERQGWVMDTYLLRPGEG